MIQTSELRIGNFIQWISTGDIEPVVKMDTTLPTATINHVSVKDAIPIPLTKEWLVKFKFKPFCNDWCRCGVIIHTRKRGFVLRKSVPDIKYVHQLQNLYFALKGKELPFC